MNVQIYPEPFDPYAVLRAHQDRLRPGSYGASAVFIGTMRDFNEDTGVQAMTLDWYPAMTERHLRQICSEALERWPIDDALIAHRVGDIQPGDPIVLCAVWSAHRAAAFEACRFLIEDLKHRAPFWKKEETSEGARWVERNTPP